MTTQVERRQNPRYTPSNARVSAVSDEFKTDFARQLFNVGLRGACIETTGRLRPDVKLNFEVRFDELGGTLRSEARIVWSDTVQQGAQEIHRAGIRFVGKIEMTQPVRDYLQGKNVASIVAQRRGEYAELKMQAQARQQAPAPKKRRPLLKAVAVLLALILVYAGSFAALVWTGRVPGDGPTVAYRYPAAAEGVLAKIYAPAYWAARKAGLPLNYAP